MSAFFDVATAPCANPVTKLITTPYFLRVLMSRQRLTEGLPLLEALPWVLNTETRVRMFNWGQLQDLLVDHQKEAGTGRVSGRPLMRSAA